MTPTTSIVTTAYNAQRFLLDSLRSVSGQSLQDIEHVVFDDGSYDSTLAIAHRHAATDPRVVVSASRHIGRNAALRSACDLASGRYIGLLDSDDVLGEHACLACSAYLDSHPRCCMVCTDYDEIDIHGHYLRLGPLCVVEYSRETEVQQFITHHFRLMRSDVFKAIGGFDPDYPAAMDYDLCLRMSEAGEVKRIRETHYQYRIHAD